MPGIHTPVHGPSRTLAKSPEEHDVARRAAKKRHRKNGSGSKTTPTAQTLIEGLQADRKASADLRSEQLAYRFAEQAKRAMLHPKVLALKGVMAEVAQHMITVFPEATPTTDPKSPGRKLSKTAVAKAETLAYFSLKYADQLAASPAVFNRDVNPGLTAASTALFEAHEG